MTDDLKQAFTLRISQANKSQMVVILYEMLLAYVQDAEVAIKAIYEIIHSIYNNQHLL